jgi:glycosyltransferase involved in cell wall biosynthesis
MMTTESNSIAPSARRRIVYLDHTAQWGGGEIALLNLVSHLDLTRFDPHVILFADGPLRERLDQQGVKATVIPLDPSVVGAKKDRLGFRSLTRIGDLFTTLRFVLHLARALKTLRADLVHTNSLKADILGGLAAKWAGIPVLWHVRDRIADDYLPRRVAKLFRVLCRLLPDLVIANSAATWSTLQLKTRSRVVHDGTLLSSPGPIQESMDAFSRIVLVGRISRWKGQHVFIQAAHQVRQLFPAAKFQIVGSPLFNEKDYECELHDMVRHLKLEDCVDFTGFRADVLDVIGQSDILVHASITGEPFGQVVIEGMAAGKPVVATRGGGIPEIVVDRVTGLLVPMGNVPKMAAAIRDLLSDPIAARKMGELGRQRVNEHFRIEHTVDKLQKIYDEILTSKTQY